MRLMENLTIRNLSFAYPGQAPLFDHCNLDLDGDWKLGLLGRNGRGKTTLMKILRNLVNYQGSIITNQQITLIRLVVNKLLTISVKKLLASSLPAMIGNFLIKLLTIP